MSSSISNLAGAVAGIAVAIAASEQAQEAPLSAQQSDPRTMTWMEGIPPHLSIHRCGGWEKVVISPMAHFICVPLPQAG
jgi:hypothetical protein